MLNIMPTFICERFWLAQHLVEFSAVCTFFLSREATVTPTQVFQLFYYAGLGSASVIASNTSSLSLPFLTFIGYDPLLSFICLFPQVELSAKLNAL